ncbi:uncharacterized protein [Elaeis guineensis]|uniref:uncharacterized protein n=1 Tax=Elaeis guineensis var. tenera TaxID=51953 RepID=UPI003C6D635A
MYLYLLHNKNEALDAFKIFKEEVEKQYGKQIKIVRSDRGGEFYGRYIEDGQAPDPFVRFLKEHSIVAQYTMPGSPDQNGVAERRNRTLLDMMRKSDYNVGAENDPETFSQAMSCSESVLWYNAMKDEMNSMASNRVWDLVELPKGVKAIGCKWVFKTKKDSLGNIERYKARLVAKGFT